MMKSLMSAVVLATLSSCDGEKRSVKEDSAKKLSKSEVLRDLRIEGEWSSGFVNESVFIDSKKMNFDDEKGNAYPVGPYSIKEITGKGGRGLVSVDGVDEYFYYKIEEQGVVFHFERAVNVRLNRLHK